MESKDITEFSEVRNKVWILKIYAKTSSLIITLHSLYNILYLVLSQNELLTYL